MFEVNLMMELMLELKLEGKSASTPQIRRIEEEGTVNDYNVPFIRHPDVAWMYSMVTFGYFFSKASFSATTTSSPVEV